MKCGRGVRNRQFESILRRPGETRGQLQAFILKGDGTIYLTMHGDVLRLAQRGSRFHVYMLATVIWHEMAHVGGADETEARRQEEELWTQFIRDNVVDRDLALRYLDTLKKRAPDGIQ